jgi:capsular exopolysaccharide synthesis family protein
VQYPEQVTEAMGLAILGAVPAIKRKRGQLLPDEAAQFIEAFRTIRVNLAHSFPGSGCVRLTISSPSAGDGKSLVASNLAVSFASAGYQTVLIDGDTRRGELHRMFGTDRRPGLLDYLQGEATLQQVVRSTDQPGLWVIPCGTRRQRGPELLGSGAMQRLLEELQAHYNAVLVDSPPLGAGVDPFVLGAATGNLMMVVRSGETDRHLAEAKLELVDRLPIRVIGAVLNDVRATGAYRYYSYLYGYASENESETAQLSSEGGTS